MDNGKDATHGAGGSQGHEGGDNSLLHLVEKKVDLCEESKKRVVLID